MTDSLSHGAGPAALARVGGVPSGRGPSGGRSRLLLAAAGLGLALASVLLYLVAVRTVAGQRADATLFGEFQDVPFGTLAAVPRDGVPVVLSGAAVACGLVAVRRRRWSSLALSVVVVAGSVVASLAARARLTRPYLGITGYLQNTYPSNHVAVTAALAVAVLVLWPSARTRGWATAAVLVLLAAACLYNVVGFAHRPADVAGGLLLAGAVAAFSLAVLPGGAVGRRNPGA